MASPVGSKPAKPSDLEKVSKAYEDALEKVLLDNMNMSQPPGYKEKDFASYLELNELTKKQFIDGKLDDERYRMLKENPKLGKISRADAMESLTKREMEWNKAAGSYLGELKKRLDEAGVMTYDKTNPFQEKILAGVAQEMKEQLYTPKEIAGFSKQYDANKAHYDKLRDAIKERILLTGRGDAVDIEKQMLRTLAKDQENAKINPRDITEEKDDIARMKTTKSLLEKTIKELLEKSGQAEKLSEKELDMKVDHLATAAYRSLQREYAERPGTGIFESANKYLEYKRSGVDGLSRHEASKALKQLRDEPGKALGLPTNESLKPKTPAVPEKPKEQPKDPAPQEGKPNRKPQLGFVPSDMQKGIDAAVKMLSGAMASALRSSMSGAENIQIAGGPGDKGERQR